MNKYLPEGFLIGNAENRELTSTLKGLEKAKEQDKILEGMAVMCDSELNISVDLYGVKGIIPRTEALYSEEPQKDIAVITRIGKPVCFKVMGFSKDEEGSTVAILSRRMAQLECRQNFVMNLVAGDIIDAKVTHMEKFGAFVDIGCGLISLMTIDSISVSRISHPKDRFSVGMNLKAVVKSIDYDTGRVYVSQKELLGTWLENASEFSVGQTVAGTIRSIEDYGVFIELAPNLTGSSTYRFSAYALPSINASYDISMPAKYPYTLSGTVYLRISFTDSRVILYCLRHFPVCRSYTAAPLDVMAYRIPLMSVTSAGRESSALPLATTTWMPASTALPIAALFALLRCP